MYKNSYVNATDVNGCLFIVKEWEAMELYVPPPSLAPSKSNTVKRH